MSDQHQEILTELEGLEKHPIFRAPPTSSDTIDVVMLGEPLDGVKFRFFCYRDVLEELRFSAQYHQTQSVCLLSGQFGIDEDGPFLEVTGFEDFRSFEHWDEVVESLRENIEHLLQLHGHGAFMAVERMSPVGFFVHQPDGGAQLEPSMIHAHLSLFNMPYQMIMAMDVPGDAFAVYAREPQGRFFNPSLYLVSVLDDAPETALELQHQDSLEES